MKAEFLNFRNSYRPFGGTPHRIPAGAEVGPVAMEQARISVDTKDRNSHLCPRMSIRK